MKKIVSLKTFSIVMIIMISMTLGACRQDDENDFQTVKTNAVNSKVTDNSQSKTSDYQELLVADPPVKNGTHWKTQN